MANLKNLEFEMTPFFEMTPDLVCIAGKDGFFRKINKSVIETLKYSEAELFARPISFFIHPEDKELTHRERTKLLHGQPLINFENRYVSKTGKIVWLHWTSIYFPEREIVFAIAKDITERKEIEKEIEAKYTKFKSLATHFKTSIEKDRKYLAIELHEELAQLASVVKLDIDWIRDHLTDLSDSSKARLEHALIVSELLINTIRRISFSLSPNILEDLGMNETVKWLCKEFAILNGIPCYFESRYKEENLSSEIKMDFFRICQEALRNIMYHAEARTVKITIKDIGKKICLTIVDDGKGFDTDQKKQTLGLTGMRERVVSINGQFKISTEIGKGTKISVTVARNSGEQNEPYKKTLIK